MNAQAHSVALPAPHPGMARYFLLFFPILAFIFVRQFYANLLGINRDLLTATLVGGMALLGVLSFAARIKEARPDFLWVDLLTLAQFYLAGLAIYAYLLAGKIHGNQAIYAIYYYMFAPLLIYSGFFFQRLNSAAKRAALLALSFVYAITFLAAICESLGIEFWLFKYDRWILQKNFLGIPRASGLYGTHIDYGLLSFFTFVIAFHCNLRKRHGLAIAMMCASAFGLLLTMSRAWVGAWLLFLFLHLTRSQPFSRRWKTAAGVLILGAVLYAAASQIGFVHMLQSADEYTQLSNESRLGFLQNMALWFDEFVLIGTGPGTQNGQPNPQQFIADFLWLAILIEYGTILGSVLVLMRMLLLLHVLRQAWKLPSGVVLKPVVIMACLTFLIASFVNSAYAHFVTVSAVYVTMGLLLFSFPPSPSRQAFQA